MSALALSCAVRTDTGPTRPHNGDAAFATPRLAAVDDGVGGHAAGEVASRTVIGALASLEKAWIDGPLEVALARAVEEGNDRIAFIAECRPETAGMGTTLTVVALHDWLVTAALDGAPDRTPAISRVPARAGDRLLLCSDGLSDVLDEPRIAELLGRPDAPDALVSAALETGARDNVTVVVADAVPVDAPVPWLRA